MAATHDSTTDETAATTPVACSLTAGDLVTQAGRWAQLAARAMIERVKTADGLRISFRSEPGAEDELRQLVATENECCPWAHWSVETPAGQTVLVVHSTGDGIATLHSMFAGPRAAPEA
jgi:hypothetical protein